MPDSPALTPERIATLRAEAQAAGQTLMQRYQEVSGLEPEAVLQTLAQACRLPAFDMAALNALAIDFARIDFSEASRRRCLAARDSEDSLWLLLADPWDSPAQTYAAHALGSPFRIGLAHPADLAALLARQEEGLRAMEGMGNNVSSDAVDQNAELLSFASIAEDASPVVRLVRSTLYDALKAGASDIHLETDARGLNVKYRIDGVLSSIAQLPGTELAEQAVSRIKIMSELDIAERRVPQDGRFKVSMQGREVDVRVSIMPSVFGEDAVLRILDRQALTAELRGLSLEGLGYRGNELARIRRLASEPYGMLLVTGPTGSGKTTTLYAAISEINHGHDKIVTIEDPVEYQLPGVLQIPVNEKKGLTFARGLRSILRHDPDKIMVGEIRDADTAQIAVQSALTGHLVFTTVHANNVFDVIGRFIHMGVDPYSFVSALNGIVAQRLLRITCPHCAEPHAPSASLIEQSGLLSAALGDFDFRQGRGCGHCRGSGYKGRRAIAEILMLTDELRELIVARAPIGRVKEAAARGGTSSLREAALALVKSGDTTLEEINRVTLAR
ncbi:MAG: general secretion pathway protein GspE [Hydrogenophilales bacterium 16-64-46]|nr:MAG: general secretion pathway protein GspE [Hydrogenophilales bacterium 12-64-13]OYZ05663.1 MAG: general secretion pathway protein GspE [Hydrogenophilales bacterium 16-64-46]OZA40242.1 MAG: general secretion pathway protein GspE [Hydrogenophilales bacterium 17-64-34]HQT00792.1 GspE/PulE family protein [Thiobacillus sp.]